MVFTLARSAIVAESGGRSQLSGLTAVAITLILLVAGTAVFKGGAGQYAANIAALRG